MKNYSVKAWALLLPNGNLVAEKTLDFVREASTFREVKLFASELEADEFADGYPSGNTFTSIEIEIKLKEVK